MPVIGDLSKPLLGLTLIEYNQLAKTIDIIFHSGALVNHVYSYEQHYLTNVAGTREVIKLSCHTQLKSIHYISAITILIDNLNNKKNIIFENTPLDDTVSLSNGYAQSKWVAEKIMVLGQQRGIPINIYRPGRITGHSITGICSPEDFLSRAIRGSIQLGIFPENLTINLTPVDYVSHSIVNIAKNHNKLGKSFNLINNEMLDSQQIIEICSAIGINMRRANYKTWKAALYNSFESGIFNPLYPYLFMLDEIDDSNFFQPYIDCRNTCKVLTEKKINWVFDSKQLLTKQINYLISYTDYFLQQYTELKEEFVENL